MMDRRIDMRVSGLFGAVVLAVGLGLASAQQVFANDSTSRLLGSSSKQIAKRVVLPVTVLALFADAAEAYSEHCQHVPDTETVSCTAEAFAASQWIELKQLGYDVSDVWSYIIVPNVEHFWDENGDDIKTGAKRAAEVGADAVIATGDAVLEYAPVVLDWIGRQLD